MRPLQEELDIENPLELEEYLRRSGRIAGDEIISVKRLTGGVSNRTVLVERSEGRNWVIKQALAKLRVEADWRCDPLRIHREAKGARWLSRLAPPDTIPALIFEDHDFHLFAMEAVPEPHENWKVMLLEGRLERDHVVQFSRLLASIHRNSLLHRDSLMADFADRSYFESLRLEPYYSFSASQSNRAAGFLNDLIAETRSRADALVHGDYSPKNVLIHQGRLRLLDHEVIHYGDPAFDLGFSLTHFLSKANHLHRRRSDFAAAAARHWRVYREELGEVEWTGDLEGRTIRHTLACLLARVIGRSPLEYLSSDERDWQREKALEMMEDPPDRLDNLIGRFCEER